MSIRRKQKNVHREDKKSLLTQTDQITGSGFSIRYLLIYVVLGIVSIAPFFSSINNEFVNWDDNINIYNASTLQQPDALKRIWFSFEMPSYIPLTDTLWYLESRIWGVQPQSAPFFHSVSILLHLINVLLLFSVVRKLGFNELTACLVAVFFAVHPWRVENVAWATEQKSLLSGIFVWLSWLGYLKATQTHTLKFRPYFISVIAFFFSLLAKPTAVGLPLILILGEWFFGNKIDSKTVKRILPYFALSMMLCVVTIARELYAKSALSTGLVMSSLEHILLAGRSSFYYILHFLTPLNLAALYPKWDISIASPSNWIYFIFLACFIVFNIRTGLKGKYRVLPFCLFGYLLFLAPVSGLIKMTYLNQSFVADRYMYLPLFFLLLGMVELIKRLQEKFLNIKMRNSNALLSVFSLILILFWSVQSAIATHNWHDSVILWKNCIDSFQGNIDTLAHYNLAMELSSKGKTEEAINYYYEAIRINPNEVKYRNNLGIELNQQGKFDEALKQYYEAIHIDPSFEKSYNNLGNALSEQGKTDEAISNFRKAIQLKPDFFAAHINIGNALLKKGEFESAVYHLNESVRITPASVQARNNLGDGLIKAGKIELGIKQYYDSLRLKPGRADTYFSLANQLAELGRMDEAIHNYSESLKLNSNSGDAHNNMANVFLMTGRLSQASAHYADAIRIDPNNAEAHYNLGDVFARQGNQKEANIHIAEALRINPDLLK